MAQVLQQDMEVIMEDKLNKMAGGNPDKEKQLSEKEADEHLEKMHKYQNGTWGIYLLLKCGKSTITAQKDTVRDKEIVIEAIENFKAGNHSVRFSCGRKVSMAHTALVIPMPFARKL